MCCSEALIDGGGNHILKTCIKKISFAIAYASLEAVYLDRPVVFSIKAALTPSMISRFFMLKFSSVLAHMLESTSLHTETFYCCIR
jgi:hypothetical protein